MTRTITAYLGRVVSGVSIPLGIATAFSLFTVISEIFI